MKAPRKELRGAFDSRAQFRSQSAYVGRSLARALSSAAESSVTEHNEMLGGMN